MNRDDSVVRFLDSILFPPLGGSTWTKDSFGREADRYLGRNCIIIDHQCVREEPSNVAKTDEDEYFRIHKMPGLFSSHISWQCDPWVGTSEIQHHQTWIKKQEYRPTKVFRAEVRQQAISTTKRPTLIIPWLIISSINCTRSSSFRYKTRSFYPWSGSTLSSFRRSSSPPLSKLRELCLFFTYFPSCYAICRFHQLCWEGSRIFSWWSWLLNQRSFNIWFNPSEGSYLDWEGHPRGR